MSAGSILSSSAMPAVPTRPPSITSATSPSMFAPLTPVASRPVSSVASSGCPDVLASAGGVASLPADEASTAELDSAWPAPCSALLPVHVSETIHSTVNPEKTPWAVQQSQVSSNTKKHMQKKTRVWKVCSEISHQSQQRLLLPCRYPSCSLHRPRLTLTQTRGEALKHSLLQLSVIRPAAVCHHWLRLLPERPAQLPRLLLLWRLHLAGRIQPGFARWMALEWQPQRRLAQGCAWWATSADPVQIAHVQLSSQVFLSIQVLAYHFDLVLAISMANLRRRGSLQSKILDCAIRFANSSHRDELPVECSNLSKYVTWTWHGFKWRRRQHLGWLQAGGRAG